MQDEYDNCKAQKERENENEKENKSPEEKVESKEEKSLVKDEFEKWGGEIVFYFKDENDFSNFKSKNFNNLPKYIVHDINENIPSENLPVFMILNDEDAKVFEAKGYQIGLGEQLLNVLK